ncbi:MAG TPA: efflux RND transporter periplasmic adaptor subunit [Gemmatimonadales bacterium]|nr:efflux RND transporter periplasmic adaptor subunit [Gemmatimonadales bacterium]
MRLFAPWGAVCVVLATPILACGGTPPTPDAAAQSADTAPFQAESATTEVGLALPAQAYVEHDAVIAARSSGVVESLFVDIGSPVEAGARLAQIEQADQRIELARAEAARDQGARTVARARALRDAQGISAAEAEEIEFAFRRADLEVQRARRAIELTRIVAPFAGRVVARYVQPGRLVSAGDTLFRIAEAEPLLARVRVPEAAARGVRVGTAIEAVTERGDRITGSVQTVAPALDAASGTREVIVRLGRSAALMPGSAISVLVGRESRRVLAVPAEAISADGFVLVRNGDRTVMRAVVLGQRLGDGRVEVISGVHAGERLARPAR